jgi:hypothetical protein
MNKKLKTDAHIAGTPSFTKHEEEGGNPSRALSNAFVSGAK